MTFCYHIVAGLERVRREWKVSEGTAKPEVARSIPTLPEYLQGDGSVFHVVLAWNLHVVSGVNLSSIPQLGISTQYLCGFI